MVFFEACLKNYLNVLIELLPNPGLVYSPVCETGPMCLVLMATPIINLVIVFLYICIRLGTVPF